VDDTALRTQLETDLKLRDMTSSVNDALRSIDLWRGELDQTERNIRALDPQASKLLAGLIAERKQQVSSMELRLARPADIPGYSMAPRLVDRLGQLLSAIDRVLAAPTPYQIEHFNELREEFLKDMGEVNIFAEHQIPEINEMLKKYNAGSLMAGKPVEMPPAAK
jgi:chromosome segregation ATPase